MKPKEFNVNTLEDFQVMIDEKNFSISEAVVNAILSNLKTRKKHIHMLSVKCTEEDTIFDITLEKINFVSTLKDNLKYFEERELYEECAKIHDGIKVLSKTK
jgi:protein-arginine kinase activator protein McsA